MTEHIILLHDIERDLRRFDVAAELYGAVGTVSIRPNILRGGNVIICIAQIGIGEGLTHRWGSMRGGELDQLDNDEWVISAIEHVLFDDKGI